ALAGWAGSAAGAEQALAAAGIDHKLRGEMLTVEQFAAIAEHKPAVGEPAADKPAAEQKPAAE
ncbi:16S rRNA (adenine(1518)-N(6)/adenine(1519)-N(6))-dimethyltransferase, partial [Kitasatospora sp. NPDC036755]